MSMLSVPEGSWSGTSGVPAPHLMRGERGRFNAFRFCRALKNVHGRRDRACTGVAGRGLGCSPFSRRKRFCAHGRRCGWQRGLLGVPDFGEAGST